MHPFIKIVIVLGFEPIRSDAGSLPTEIQAFTCGLVRSEPALGSNGFKSDPPKNCHLYVKRKLPKT